MSQEHAERVWRTLEKYVLPKLQDTPIENITRRDAIDILCPLEQRQKLSTIKRLCQSLNQIMEYAVDCDIISANPLTRMIKAFETHKVEHMTTIRPEMLNELLSQLESNQRI
ncbi:tyrosine-type recombinase/integrase [Vibrio bathopelagicus]